MNVRTLFALVFGLSLLGAIAQSANDAFANAATINANTTVSGTTVNATREIGEPAPYTGMSRSVWYNFTAPLTTTYTVSINGSYRETLGVYSGTAVNALTTNATATAGNFGTSAALNFPATAGNVYRIQVDGRGSQSGTFNLTVSTPAPTVALTAPVPLSYYTPPTNVVMTATASANVAGATISGVYFYTNNAPLVLVTNAPFTYTWTNPPANAPAFYGITAVAVDSLGAAAASGTSNITVYASNQRTFIRHGDSWKYLDNGVDQGTAWIAPTFDDSSWSNGVSELGYGDTVDGRPEATVINFGPDTLNRYITYYFRKSFVLNNASLVTNLTARLLRDDGAAVYLNGVEIQRNNLAAGATYATLAGNAVDDGTTWFPTNVSPSLLVDGTNVIAVEVHQNAANSSDVSFDFDLIASLSANSPPTVQITNPSNGAFFQPGATITINATANDPDAGGAVTNVSFYAGATFLGRATSAPFSYTWNSVPEGSYTLTAVATDNSGQSTTSSGVDITVSTTSVVPVTLIATGSVWKYLDDGSDQGTAWQPLAFNDGAWASGPGELGYGDLPEFRPEATVLCCSNAVSKFITYYFRKTFTVTNVSAISNLTINLVRDDGAVVYINGTEVRRDNLPAGAITSATLALAAVGGADEATYFASNASPSVLVNGTNIIAVEIHQSSTTSSDISFDLSLVADTVVGNQPTNTVAPFVQSVSPPAGSSVSSLTSVQVTFSEAVTGVNASDLLVNGFPATGLSGSGNIYTFTFAQPGFGTVNFTWAGGHGIADIGSPSLPFDGNASSNQWSYNLQDLVAPTVVSRVPVAGATVTNLTQVQVTFSEPVTGVDAGDLLMNGTPAINVSSTGNTNFTFGFNPPGPGTITMSWAASHGIADSSANAFNSSGGNWTYSYFIPTTVLSGSNTVWRFIKGLNEASSPVTAWRALAFDDSNWSNAAAPFYYGDPYTNTTTGVGTLLSDMNGAYQCIYLRKPFVISSPAAVSNFVYRHQSDDGFVLWINGVEALRFNVDPALVDPPYNPGTGPIGNAQEPGGNGGAAYISVTNTAALGALVAGTNIIAVQAFNVQLTGSSDFGFNLQFESMMVEVDPTNLPPRITSITPTAGEVTALTNITINFSERVQNVDAGDLLINGSPATSVSNLGQSNYTFAFTQPAYGNVTVTFAGAHGIVDFDSPPKPFDASAATFQYTLVNPSAPVVSSQTPLANATLSSLTNVTVTFNKAVSGVDASDLRVAGSPAAGVTGGPAIYTFTFPQPPYGSVAITWSPAHGIADAANGANTFNPARPGNTWSYTLLDQTAPTIIAKTPSGGAAVTNLTSVTVTFSEAVLGVNASDLLVNGIPATNLVANNSSNYTFTFAPPNATVINITWAAAHGITDTAPAPNNFNSTGPGATWSYTTPDTVAPTISATTPEPFITVRSLNEIRVTFTEPVTGVDAADLLINNQPSTSVAGGGAGPYIFTFTQPSNGPVEIRWATTHGIADLAANPYAAGEWTYVLNPSAVFAGNIVINELMFDSASGRTNDEWLELANVSSDLINLAGWRITKGVSFTFPNVSIPAGGYLVVAADVATFQSNYPTVTNVVGGWTGTLNNNGETIKLQTALGEPVSELKYATEGDWAIRRRGNGPARVLSLTRSGSTATATVFNHSLTTGDQIIITGADQPEYNGRFTPNITGPSTFTYTVSGTPASPATGGIVSDWVLDDANCGWAWFNPGSGFGYSMELVNARHDITSGQNWAGSTNAGGTPGRANSVATTNIAPLIRNVAHYPPVPRSIDPVTITALVKDELTNGISAVQLFYRSVTTTTPGAFGSTNMFDDGLHNDGATNDGAYAVSLPAMANGTIIEFYVRATDTGGRVRTWPAPSQDTNGPGATFGALGQYANALYMVDNELPTNTMPVIRMVMKASDAAIFPPGNRNSDAAFHGTMIAVQGSSVDIRYNCDARVRGAGTRSRTPTNNRLNIPNDNLWNGRSAINLNSQFIHAQLIGNLLAEQSGLMGEQSYAVQYRINAVNPAGSFLTAPARQAGNGAGWGAFLLVRPVDGDLASEIYPQDGDGNTYRASVGGHTAVLNNLGANPDSYLNAGYFKTSNKTENDWTDLINLTAALSYTGNNSNYISLIRSNIHVQNWMTYFAVSTLLNDGETSMANGIGDDYGLYRGLLDPRFVTQPHDFDTVFGEGDTGPGYYPINTNASVFIMLNPPNGNANMPLLRRFMTNNAFAPVFWSELKRLCDTIFSPEQLGSLMEYRLGTWGLGPDDTVIQRMKDWAECRRQVALSQIPLTFSVNNSLATQNGYLFTTTPSVTLFGSANAIDTRRVLVNGQDSTWWAFDGRWTNTFNLQPGLNRVLVQTLNSNNTELVRQTLDIWYSNAAPVNVSGTIASDTTWTAAGGPYLVTANLTVSSPNTLTIQPGTTVYLNSGANISVANGARIIADGTDTAHIRFTRQPGTAGNWGNITFNGAVGSVESRLQYVDLEFSVANASTPALQVTGGTVFFDHLTFGQTGSPYIHVDGASFVIQNCVFPTPTAAFEPVHGTGGVKSGGRGLFLRNWFGIPNGYNDVVDFTGGNRPGQPIVQFINNVFTGASDDILDLDGTDAWIEGNIFMHAHRNGSPDSSSAISGGNDPASDSSPNNTSELTIIGNLIYDCDMAFNAKQYNFYTLLNNTVVRITKQGGLNPDSAVALLADVGTHEGNGAYIEGNILYDVEGLVLGRTNAAVTITNNIIYGNLGAAWSGPGGNNSTNDPLFNFVPAVAQTSNFTTWASAQVLKQWFGLRADSPARGGGINGRDKGGVVPLGVSISGEPATTTSRNFATLSVGPNRRGNGIPAAGWTNGAGFVTYKWRLDGGAWSAEISITNPISLINLANGPHYVEVVGKRDALMFQDDPANGADAVVTVSRTWSVNTSLPGVRINEVLASNGGSVPVGLTTPDLVELFNDTGAPLDLGGFGITDDLSNPYKFTFTNGTVIPAGGYLVLYANNPDTNAGIHLGFNIPAGGGVVALFNNVAGGGQQLDAVTFGTQVQDYSIGRLADGSWALCIPTFGSGAPLSGAVNRQAVTGDPFQLRINEWLTSGTAPFDNDFVELYNLSSLPVSLGGLFLSDAVAGWPTRHTVAPLTFVAANGYYRFIADGNKSQGAEHLDFSLASDVGTIGLFSSNAVLIDSVLYQPQSVNVSQGRSPNGGTNVVFFQTPTPGAPNPIVSGPLPFGGALVINEVLAGNANLAETFTVGASNITTTPDWVELYNGTTTNIDLVGLSLTDDSLQPRRFVFTNTVIPPAGFLRVLCSPKLPVSATNTGFGLKSTGGAVYLFDRPASGGTLLNSIVYGIQIDDFSIGRVPDGSTNWALASPTPFAANVAIPSLGSPSLLKVNEWMADPASGPDWFEIYNGANAPVALGGLYLSDTPANRTKHKIAALSFIGTATNAWTQFIADGNTSQGADHVSFSLAASAESVIISDTNGNQIDGYTWTTAQTTGVSQGRFPDGSANVIQFPGTESPGRSNYRLLTSIVINEALTHTDEPLEDAIELFNTTGQAIDVSGWWLSDDPGTLQKYQLPFPTVVPAYGFTVIYETHFTNVSEASIPFALSSTGDEIVLSTASNNVLTGFRGSVKFGAQHNGTSFGRFVTSDGNEQFVSMSARTFGVDDPGTVQSFRTGNGKTNAYPKVGPIVISQIMYHPPDINGTNDNVPDEFIELRNISGAAVPLYDPLATTNTWRFRDAVDYDFPQGITVPAAGRLVVVSFDPVNSPAQLAAFRNKYLVPASIPVFGPYVTKLANSDAKVELYEPDTPNTNGVPYVLVERVHYYDAAPWPAAADGSGAALVRRGGSVFGNEPTNWVAAAPSFSDGDYDGDGMPDSWEIQYQLNAANASDANVDSDGDGLTNLQEFQAGTNPRDATDSLRILTADPVSTNIVLTFRAVSNKTYTVQYKDVLSTNWARLIDVSAAPTNRVMQITTPRGTPARFYQVRTPVQP